jgi:hypothetical protein
MTPDISDREEGRGDAWGECLGDLGTATEAGLLSFCILLSIDVGGGSCGGDICGVIMAGSFGPFLCSAVPLGLPSWEEVPAGVSGGECIAEVGGDGR